MQLGSQQNWTDSADLAMLYRGLFTTAFYRQLHTVVHKEFRARQTLRQFRRRQMPPIRHLAGAVYHILTLPAARLRLNRLARVPHAGLKPMPHMPRHEAAKPSQQV
jgi:anaerobic magnesium-protoporphyrin IX monomethyl ester cyclase